MFECPNCKDTERRLLPCNHHLVVETSAALSLAASACAAPVDQSANENTKPPEEAVTVSDKADHFLHDPAKFIEMFVRNRERNRS